MKNRTYCKKIGGFIIIIDYNGCKEVVMQDIKESRKIINEVDEQMARLFEQRMQACEQIALYKKENGLSVRDSEREEQVVANNAKLIQNPALVPYYKDFIRSTMDVSCHYQASFMRKMRVAYCGTKGAFAHIAAKRMYPDAEYIAFSNFRDAYDATQKGNCDCSVLPLENSYAGEVGEVMDLIFSGDLHVNQVVDVAIAHNLIAKEGAQIEDIKIVVSHPQALAQCEEYIKKHGFETRAYSNTALAAKYVAEAQDASVAALASDETARIFSLSIVQSHVNDNPNNTTRFAAFSRAENVPVSIGKREDENFILAFTVQNESGALASALNIIGAHNFNMRTLRSRPMKDLQWNYYFYIEAEGNVRTENGRDMLQELSALCAKLKLVGSYFADNVR